MASQDDAAASTGKEKTGISGWAYRKSENYKNAAADREAFAERQTPTPAEETYQRLVVPSKLPISSYPIIDNDPHFKRVVGYMRPSDYAAGTATALLAPAGLYLMERVSPSYAGRGGFTSVLRVSGMVGLCAGFFLAYQRSTMRFYGASENAREVQLDMREMVDKAKRREPLYGVSTMSEYMQGVSARNSRYSGMFLFAIPWFNLSNHNQHGVDTAKYYQQAERELEAEKAEREG